MLVYGKRKSTEKGKASRRGVTRRAGRSGTAISSLSRGESASWSGRTSPFRRKHERTTLCRGVSPRYRGRVDPDRKRSAAKQPCLIISGTPPGRRTGPIAAGHWSFGGFSRTRRCVMRRSRRIWPRLVALCGSCLLVPALTMLGEGRGQVINAVTGQTPLVFDQVVGQPMGLPRLPPQGAWGEVINVTSRWIVIQNHSGQQFPIALDDINEFLVRWPIGLDILNNDAVVEA